MCSRIRKLIFHSQYQHVCGNSVIVALPNEDNASYIILQATPTDEDNATYGIVVQVEEN